MRVVFTFGRFNPPTIGHEKLLKKVSDVAKSNDYYIYASFSQSAVKDPLPHKDKVSWMKRLFPNHSNRIVSNTKAKSAIDVLVELYGKDYTDVVMVVGSDRVSEFRALLNRYNGTQARHGYYEFNTIEVVSAGERDPDSEGVEGMSASKMRNSVKDGDSKSFATGLPNTVKDSDKKKLFDTVKKYMGLNEYYEEGTPEYRRYLQRITPEEDELDFPSERALSDAEKKTKEKMVLSFKKNTAFFKRKYGKRWKEVMYATATNVAKNEGEMMEDKVDYGMDTLRPFDKEHEDPLVDLVRKVIGTGGGDKEAIATLQKKNFEVDARKESDDTAPEPPEPKTDNPNLFKVDGRSKEYRSTVDRISKGAKRKGEGIDGRSKGFKSTMNRISARRAKAMEKGK